MALFIIPDFLTPNIHYSFSFKPRYSLFIIQFPPPILAGFAILGTTEPDLYRGSATGIPRNEERSARFTAQHLSALAKTFSHDGIASFNRADT